MTLKHEKTVLRTIGITQEVDTLLRSDASARGLSVNTLVSQILSKYSECDRYAEKFVFITIAAATFRSILEAVDDEKLAKTAAKLGAELPKAVALFWFKKVSLQTFLDTIALFAKYSNLQVHETKIDEKECTIVFRHALGQKWSTFFRHFISHAVQNALGVFPHSEVSENSIMIGFRLP